MQEAPKKAAGVFRPRNRQSLTLQLDLDDLERLLAVCFPAVSKGIHVLHRSSFRCDALTLAIRRLDLHVGSSESIIAAWVKFPELTVQPLSQRCTRIAKDTYRYESHTGFSAEIVVDDLGLVTVYPSGWERIGTI
jgi:hypothetical protein